MRNLLLLIRKDWMHFISKKLHFFGCLLIWIPLTSLIPTSTTVFFIVTTYIFVFGMFQFEENDLVCNIRAILPVRKRDIVFARYLYAYTVIVIQTLLVCLFQPMIHFLLRGTSFGVFTLSHWSIPLLAAVCASLLMFSITMPLIYRFGFMKTRILTVLVYGALVGVGTMGSWSLTHEVPVPTTGSWLAVCGAFFLLSLVSMAVSLRIAR